MGWKYIRSFARDEAGAALIYVGFAMFAIAGFAGLSIDVGHWYATQRAAQTAADSAAVAGAREALWGGDAAAIKAAAEAQAALNGFDAATVSVTYPYSHLNGAETTQAVEVIIQQPTRGFFSSVIRADNAVNIAARSVSGPVAGVAACLLMTDPTMSGAISLSGGSEITATGCGLHANSTDDRAVDTSGGTVTAESVSTSGGFKAGSEANITGETADYVAALADPLAYMPPPPVEPCSLGHETTTKVTGGDTITLDPGVYCGGIEGTGGSEIILRAGYYVIKDGLLLSSGGGTLKVHDADYAAGRGVGIYFTGIDSYIKVTGGGHVTLRADNEGPMPGILFWGAEPAPGSKKDTNVFSGGTDTVYEGTMYFPHHHIKYTGGSTVDVAQVGSIIARSFLGSGGGSFHMDRGLTGSGTAVSAALGAESVAILE